MRTSGQPRPFYRWTRDLHLYIGLFVSPFVLLFAASVFFLNHGKLSVGLPPSVEIVQGLEIPPGIEDAEGRDAIKLARRILVQLRVTGEIGFLRQLRQTRHLIFPVSKPGLETTIDVDLNARSAAVSRRRTGLWETVGYLHKSPGPHNAAIRGNWMWTRVWRWFADATVYLTLFLSVSGLYLWFALRAERRIGILLLSAGGVSLFGLIYVVIR